VQALSSITSTAQTENQMVDFDSGSDLIITSLDLSVDIHQWVNFRREGFEIQVTSGNLGIVTVKGKREGGEVSLLA